MAQAEGSARYRNIFMKSEGFGEEPQSGGGHPVAGSRPYDLGGRLAGDHPRKWISLAIDSQADGLTFLQGVLRFHVDTLRPDIVDRTPEAVEVELGLFRGRREDG